MSNLHTLQILQKNTLSSLQSLIDFTNATLTAPPTPAPVAPTLTAPPPTLPEDAITLQDLEIFFRYLHTTESNAYKNMYGWLMRMYGTTFPASKLLTLFEKISGKNNTLLIEQTYVSEKSEVPTETDDDDIPVYEEEKTEDVSDNVVEEDDEDEDDDAPIQDTYDWYSGIVLTEDQKLYRQLLFAQNWKELAERYMRAIKNVFEPYYAGLKGDITIVETHQEYKFLVQTAIENRNKFGDVLLPDTLIQWEKLPTAFLDECKGVFRRELLFQPATFKHSIFKDVLKVHRYFSNLQCHYTWKSKFNLIKDSHVNIQDLITNWIQEGKVTEEQRDYVITAITFANFCKSGDIGNSSSNYIGSNQFSQNFFAALEKTKGLPAGFMNWITNGITYKHFKKVLTEMGIQQVRRAEGQRYQGIRMLNDIEGGETVYDENGYRLVEVSEKDPKYMENVFSSQNNQEKIQAYTPGDGLASFEDDRELNFYKEASNMPVSSFFRNSSLSVPAFAAYPEQEKAVTNDTFGEILKISSSDVQLLTTPETRGATKKLQSLNDVRSLKLDNTSGESVTIGKPPINEQMMKDLMKWLA